MTATLDRPRQASTATAEIKLPSGRASSFALALGVFVFINLIGHAIEYSYTQTVVNPVLNNPALRKKARSIFALPVFPRYNMLDNGLDEFFSRERTPDCVILGSSLMYDPFYALDRPRIDESVAYHYCLAFEDSLKAAGLKYSPVMNLAVSGAMVSDLEQITQHVFKDTHKPKWIIIGLTPGTLVGAKEVATPSFKRLAGTDEYLRYFMWYRSSFDDAFQLVVTRLSPLHFYRRYWQQKLGEGSSHMIKSWTGDGRALSMAPPEKSVRSVATEPVVALPHKTAWQANIRVAVPPRPPGWRQALTDHLSGATKAATLPKKDAFNAVNLYVTYSLLFNLSLSRRTLDIQLASLARLLDLSRDRGMRVLLIDMPMTEPYLRLLPDGFESLYHRRLDQVCRSRGALMLRASDVNFSDGDFADGVHLNATGGKKLVSKLVQVMASAEASK